MRITYDFKAQPAIHVHYSAYAGGTLIWSGSAPFATIHMMPDAKNSKTVKKARRASLGPITLAICLDDQKPLTITYTYGMRPALWVVYMMSIHAGKTPIWLGCASTANVLRMPDAARDELVPQFQQSELITIDILSLHETEKEAEIMRDGWLAAYHPYFIRSKYILDEKPRGRPSHGPVIELKTKAEFDSASAAARYFKITRAQVSRSIRRKSATSKGLKFRYIEDGY